MKKFLVPWSDNSITKYDLEGGGILLANNNKKDESMFNFD